MLVLFAPRANSNCIPIDAGLGIRTRKDFGDMVRRDKGLCLLKLPIHDAMGEENGNCLLRAVLVCLGCFREGIEGDQVVQLCELLCRSCPHFE